MFFPYKKVIKDVAGWSPILREKMEKLYGVEYFPQLWAEWLVATQRILNENGGNYCKDKLGDIEAKTLILHGAKDPVVAPEHIPFMRKSIKSTE